MLADDRKVDLESARGVLVYRDAAIPTLFYYASTRPAIARGADGYQLALVHYDKPAGGIAGMLSFVVDLKPSEAEIAAMRDELAARAGAAVQCLPIPWTAGTVAIALAGSSPVSGSPSLLGDNAAAVSIPLTTDQYVMLRRGATASAAPAWAVYSLSFDALRPAYGASIRVDATRLRSWLQKKCTANFAFISVEKTETFEELTASGVLRIEQDSMTGEPVPDGLRSAFLRSLQSVLAPLPRFGDLPEGGGSGWLIGFDCSTMTDTQKIARRLDTDMRLTDVVARKAWIQGELAGLEQALAARPDVELPTGFSFVQALTVRCHDAFDGQPLDTANVQFEPAGMRGGFHSFTRPGEAWPLELAHAPGSGDGGYDYRCSFYFRGRPAGSAGSSDSGLLRVGRDQAFLDIVPAAFFTWRRYSVSVADDFPWDLVASVRLALAGPPALAFAPGQAVLVRAAPGAVIEAFAALPLSLDEVSYSAAVTRTAGGGAPFPLAGLAAGASIFLNPFSRRTVSFRMPEGFDWEDTRIDIGVEAQPDKPQLWASANLALTAAAPQARFSYWYTNDKTLRFHARIRRKGQDTAIASTDAAQIDVVLALPAPATQS